MDNRKKREREELHKTIWKAADDFVHAGKVAAWDFKEYFLGIMFYRFISENIENYINEIQHKSGDNTFEYRNISDEVALRGKNQILEEKGLFILPSELFCNVRKIAKDNDNLNVILANTFDNIENSARGTASENDVKGLFDSIDMTSNKIGDTVAEKNENLEKLLNVIGDLPLGDYKSNTIDLFGDAYEYLMSMYASTAGKKGGEFFTPQEVGELLARIVIMDKKEVNKVYDPCCGSGGLLLKFAKILGKENVRNGFYGQEINLTTYNLARINMFLHDINYDKFNIAREDTLIHPMHWDDEPFDAIVSNPPYSVPWVGNDNPILINDERFAPAGVLAPKSKADLAFTMHMLSWLSPKGTAAIVEFPGVLYRGGAEQKIRQYMVDNNFVDTIIQLPSDLFFGTSIATCILVLKKNKKDNNILFVNASNECVRSTNKNRISSNNISNIINLLKERKTKEGRAYIATYDEVKENDYNLSVNSYLKTTGTGVEINIEEVNKKLVEVVPRQKKIREELEKIIKELDADYNVKDLIKKLCPNGVEYKKLDDVCEKIYAGGTPLTSHEEYYNGNIKWLRSGEINFNEIYDTEIKITTEGLKNSSTKLIPSKSVVIAMTGATVARTAIIMEEMCMNQSVCALIPKDELNYRFLYQYLTNIYRELKNSGQGVLTSLNLDRIKKIIIPLPPIEVQEEIVKILDKFRELETELETELEIELETRKQQYEFYKNKLLHFEEIDNGIITG